MQVNQRRLGAALNYLSEGIKILTTLVYTPLMLRLLGQSEYGLYQLVSATVSYLSLLNLGFGSAYVRFFSRYKVKGDEKAIARLNGMFMIFFCIMAVICLICGVVMAENVKGLFGSKLTAGELAKSRTLLLILIVNMAITFPNSVFNCYVTAHEKFVFQKILTVAQNILNPFLGLPLLLMGYDSVAIVTVTTLLTLGSFLANIIFCRKKLKMDFSFRKIELSLFAEVFTFTFFLFLNQIIDQVNWNVDKFLLGRICGTAAVAVYGVAAQINAVYMNFSAMIPSLFVPEINRIVANNQPDRDVQLSNRMCDIGRIIFMIALYIYIGFVFCGRSFIQAWVGEGYEDAYIVALLLISPLVIILPHSIAVEIRRAKNQHRVPALFMLVTSVCNVLISIQLAIHWGPIGAAAGTFVSFIINQIMIDIYYVKVVRLNIALLFQNIKEILFSCAIPIIIGLFGLVFDSLWKCALWAVLYSALYFFFLFRYAMTEKERGIITAITKRFIKSK